MNFKKEDVDMTEMAGQKDAYFIGCRKGSKEVYDEIRAYLVKQHRQYKEQDQHGKAHTLWLVMQDLHDMYHCGRG